jgi:GNAT superfamily N-acetyltransferase
MTVAGGHPWDQNADMDVRRTIREILPPETGAAFLAMRALRTHLSDEAEFVRLVDEVQRPEGYRLVGAYEGDEVAAVAGFRVLNELYGGRYLYVDDLATRPEFRRRGHARALLDWLIEEARHVGCDNLQLDSAVGLDRADAHRLYMNAGLVIAAHHFARRV